MLIPRLDARSAYGHLALVATRFFPGLAQIVASKRKETMNTNRLRIAMLATSLGVSLVSFEFTPAHGQPPPSLPVAASQREGMPDPNAKNVLIVTRKHGLAQAIDHATRVLEDPQYDEFTIVLGNCNQQILPPEINAKGKITILGCGANAPAGVNIDLSSARTPLLPPTTFGGTIVSSPLEVRGVAIAYEGSLFTTADSITIKNSILRRVSPSNGTHFAVVETTFDQATSANKKVVIEDNDLEWTKANTGSLGEAEFSFKRNRVVLFPRSTGPVVTISGKGADPKEADIEGNAFWGKAVLPASTMIVVERANTSIDQNTMTYVESPEPVIAISVLDTSPGFGAPLRNIKIEHNTIEGGVALTNPTGTPLKPGAVKLRKNHFGGIRGMLPKGKPAGDALHTVSPAEAFDAAENYWGKVDLGAITAITDKALTNPNDAGPDKPKPKPKPPVTPPVQPPVQPPTAPSPSPTPGNPGIASTAKLVRFAGETRVETAVAIAKAQYKDGAKSVILARADVPVDSISAVPLAEEMDAPVLLTQPDRLHPATAAEIKRLFHKGGKVIVMGGIQAITPEVEAAVTALGVQVERIAGPNRAGTAVETANRLQRDDKLKQFLVVDGTDWQADMAAGPAAAEVDGALLLTNGSAMAPETKAFLDRHAKTEVMAIGANAKVATKATKAIEGADGSALSLAVAKHYFAKPKAVGVATTADFADALAGGAHIADADGPILLVGRTIPADTLSWIRGQSSITSVMVYGGTSRIPDTSLDGLTKR